MDTLLAQAGEALGGTGDFTYDRLLRIAYGLVSFALGLTATIMMGAVIFYGLQIATAGSNAARYESGKKNLWYAMLGFAVAAGSWVIVRTVRSVVENQSFF